MYSTPSDSGTITGVSLTTLHVGVVGGVEDSSVFGDVQLANVAISASTIKVLNVFIFFILSQLVRDIYALNHHGSESPSDSYCN